MGLRLVDGPFRRLEGMWQFKPLTENACKIDFRLSYEFSSKMFEKVIGPVFSQIANTFVDAFVRRADTVYGGQNNG
jgi:ribosome-associated toxin RatA of RatAB toxin-antitoxin module